MVFLVLFPILNMNNFKFLITGNNKKKVIGQFVYMQWFASDEPNEQGANKRYILGSPSALYLQCSSVIMRQNYVKLTLLLRTISYFTRKIFMH